MPFLQVKKFFMVSVAANKFFRLLDAVSNVGLNLEIFKEMGRVCSNIILSLITGNSRDSCQIGKFIQIIYKSCIDCKVHRQF